MNKTSKHDYGLIILILGTIASITLLLSFWNNNFEQKQKEEWNRIEAIHGKCSPSGEYPVAHDTHSPIGTETRIVHCWICKDSYEVCR